MWRPNARLTTRYNYAARHTDMNVVVSVAGRVSGASLQVYPSISQPIATHRAQQQEKQPPKLESNQVQIPKPRRSLQVTFTCNKCGTRAVDTRATAQHPPSPQTRAPSGWSTPRHGSAAWFWHSAVAAVSGTSCRTTGVRVSCCQHKITIIVIWTGLIDEIVYVEGSIANEDMEPPARTDEGL